MKSFDCNVLHLLIRKILYFAENDAVVERLLKDLQRKENEFRYLHGNFEYIVRFSYSFLLTVIHLYSSNNLLRRLCSSKTNSAYLFNFKAYCPPFPTNSPLVFNFSVKA